MLVARKMLTGYFYFLFKISFFFLAISTSIFLNNIMQTIRTQKVYMLRKGMGGDLLSLRLNIVVELN